MSRQLSEKKVVPPPKSVFAPEILRLVLTGSFLNPAGRLDQPGLFLMCPVAVSAPAFMVGKVQ